MQIILPQENVLPIARHRQLAQVPLVPLNGVVVRVTHLELVQEMVTRLVGLLLGAVAVHQLMLVGFSQQQHAMY